MQESLGTNRVTVVIYGQEYTIKGDESKEYVENVARYVDRKMRQIGQKSPQLTLPKVAILTALNIADELHKLQQDYEALIRLIEEGKKA